MNRRFHLVGIGGVGMSALAEALAGRGAWVTGSDRDWDRGLDRPVFSILNTAGVRLFPQDGSGVVPGVDAVVFSTAVEPDNPDARAARARGIPRRHRAEMLADLVGPGRCLAVAGTSGKTTVTGMLGWMLEAAGLDPSVVNGGAVRDWRRADRTGHTRKGGSDIWVIEADESDRSLLRYSPEWAVLTTVSEDHFDADETTRLFQAFAGRVRRTLVTTRIAHARLGLKTPCRLADPRGFSPTTDPDGSRFRYGGLCWTVPLPGLHNAWNARLAAATCKVLGCDLKKARNALAGFGGIHRRFEVIVDGPVRVVDDYAHNPEKIRAAWMTAAARGGRILAVWRPHGFGPLRTLRTGLRRVFSELCRAPNQLILLPVYYAGGTAQAEVTSADLAEDLRQDGIAVTAVPGYEEARHALETQVRPGDTLLIMGARDPELPVFARRQADRCSSSPRLSKGGRTGYAGRR